MKMDLFGSFKFFAKTIKKVLEFCANKAKDYFLNCFLVYYKWVDSKASNATFILLSRHYGSLVFCEPNSNSIYLPTLYSNGENTEPGNYYPDLFPKFLNLRLDYVDSTISENLVYSLIFKVCMKIMKFFFQFRFSIRYITKFLFPTVNGGKFYFIPVIFALMRTHGGDAMVRWAILYGQQPELGVKNHIEQIPDRDEKNKSELSRSTIFLSQPIDRFNQKISCNIETNGVQQIIIIGAGFDCRAFKYAGLRKYAWNKMSEEHEITRIMKHKGYTSIPVFEVDQPHVQRIKRAAIQKEFDSKTLEQITEDVYYLACDLQVDSIKECLEKVVESSASTLILFEGVTFYIQYKYIEKTFMELKDLFTHNKSNQVQNPSKKVYMIFDYADDYFNTLFAKGNTNIVQDMMKLPCTTLKADEIENTLENFGWKHIKTWSQNNFREVFENSCLSGIIEYENFPLNITLCEI